LFMAMKKNIIINSTKKIDQSFFDLFCSLGLDNNFFISSSAVNALCQPLQGSVKKIYFPPNPDEIIGRIIFFISLPFFWLGYSFWLASLGRNLDKIVCVGAREKIIFTPLAKFFKIKIIWLELPGSKIFGLSRLGKIFSAKAELVVFSARDEKDLIESGTSSEKICNISLGVNFQATEQQDNIFSSLAKADKPYSFYKNFTVGVICENDDRRRLEVLLQAVKGCLNLIPNFRLVVIGQDTGSGNLSWLIKSLGLERRVWLVGEQKNLSQWFSDLDLYVVLAKNPQLGDLERALAAAACGVPLLGFPSRNISDIISEGQNGIIVQEGGAEAIVQEIITFEADERSRRIMGENGKKLVQQDFDRQRQLDKLKMILEKS
jgi:glycosyltransferase involved in cell wall biosynthesis